MTEPNLVTDEIWPLVKTLITATMDGDEVVVAKLLRPRGHSAEILDIFGLIGLELLLKTILDRNDVSLARVIRAEKGKSIYVEYAWIDPEQSRQAYIFADAVTVLLQRYRNQWRVVEINPSTLDQWLTGPTARGLLANMMEGNDGRMPHETWVLPLAFVGGAVRLVFRPNALRDEVEQALLPGMQERGYGVTALVNARRMWRDYVKQAQPEIGRAALWAAAVEFLMSEQALIDTPQAFVGEQYGITLVQMVPRVRMLRERLRIDSLDVRYSPIRGVNIVTTGSA